MKPETGPSKRPDIDLLRHIVAEDATVRAYVRSVTRGHRETEDVIQEVWRVVCRKIDTYDETRPFRAWLIGITRMQLLKWRQEQARSRVILSPELVDLLAETAAEVSDELDHRAHLLRQCLRAMPAPGRQVLHLFYFMELKIADIAARLRKNVAAVEMALVRARRALRACVDEKLAAGGVACE